jgi:hypothetical protein
MARVIDWLHQNNMRDYKIQPGVLSRHTISGEAEKIRRNKFYLAFGFELSGTDENNASANGLQVVSGQFTAPTTGDLKVPEKYLSRLISGSNFNNNLRTERYNADRNASELAGSSAWARGHTRWFGWIKRIVLFLMNSPINRR